MARDGGEPTAVGTHILNEVAKVVVGHDDMVEIALAAIISGGHVLIEDRPGVGKTLLARTLATVMGLEQSRIQGTSDLLPSDVTGIHVFEPQSGSWTFRSGPIFSESLLFDELNRATPKAQSALLEAMAEGHVTVDGQTMALPKPFVVIATQNPSGDVGTYRLGSAQVDRFAVVVSMGLPSLEDERAIVTRSAGTARLDDTETVITASEVAELREHVGDIEISEALIDYGLEIIEAIRLLGDGVWLSVRVSETLFSMARGLAFMRNRDFVIPEDFQDAALPVTRHRIDESVSNELIAKAVEIPVVPVHGG